MSSAPPPNPPDPHPTPKKRRLPVWEAVSVAVLLAAALVALYFVAVRDSDDGSGAARGGCTGDYCLGAFPYANACGAFPPASFVAQLGNAGGKGLAVRETYADPLPPSAGDPPPPWTEDVRSRCAVTPLAPEDAVFSEAIVTFVQSGSGDVFKQAQGDPLPGFDGSVVVRTDVLDTVTWERGNVMVRFDVFWKHGQPALPDTTLANAATAIDSALADPPGPRTDLSTDGERVVVDACELFTGMDFQVATGYTADPRRVGRSYRSGPGPQDATCERTSPHPGTGFPEAEGTTIPDLSPRLDTALRISQRADPAEAKAGLDKARAELDGAQNVPGVGDSAVYGSRSLNHSLVFTSGPNLVTVSWYHSPDTTGWNMRERLEPVAKAVAGRMP